MACKLLFGSAGGFFMITYCVHKGDTIARVTRQLNTTWKNIQKNNPEAIGRSRKNGNWFLKEGATLKVENSFAASLQQARQDTAAPAEPLPQIRPESGKMGSSPVRDVVLVEEKTASPASLTIDRRIIRHRVQPGETLWELAVKRYHVNLQEIMAANNITDPRTLQIGQELKIPQPEYPREEQVVASWYGRDFHGRPMANGDIYDMYAATIAHKEIPLGTRVELKNSETGEKVQAVVTDRGPYVEGRDVDLSYGLAKKLSLLDRGVGNLVMRIL
jgi:rare lipoprotein A